MFSRLADELEDYTCYVFGSESESKAFSCAGPEVYVVNNTDDRGIVVLKGKHSYSEIAHSILPARNLLCLPAEVYEDFLNDILGEENSCAHVSPSRVATHYYYTRILYMEDPYEFMVAVCRQLTTLVTEMHDMVLPVLRRLASHDILDRTAIDAMYTRASETHEALKEELELAWNLHNAICDASGNREAWQRLCSGTGRGRMQAALEILHRRYNIAEPPNVDRILEQIRPEYKADERSDNL